MKYKQDDYIYIANLNLKLRISGLTEKQMEKIIVERLKDENGVNCIGLIINKEVN